MREIKLNQSEMMKFYRNFDVINFKYKKLLDRLETDKLDKYLELQQYEEEKQFAELTKKEVWDLQEDLDLAYADRRISDEYLEVFDMVCEKIVRSYINVDGMERLFSEKYAEFEWEMHLGVDYKKHAMNFYRDHFIHQVKDAYTMAMLLQDGGFYEKIQSILKDEGSSKIARFVNKMIRQQLRLPRTIPFTDDDFDKKNDEEQTEDKQQKTDKKQTAREALAEHYMYNIIYMSSYIAGLFHDIGYPAVMAMEDSRRMIGYLIEMHHFEQSSYDFKQIMSLLQNSLLFRVVSSTEIRGRIEGDKVDHGTMSALLLLLHFYENGAIHRLEPYKLCAVELAALAIYNHTNGYTYIGDKDAEYERPVFSLNPISYLLRVCDDLQEWGRIYFEVADKSNLIICSTCHMPIIRRPKRDLKAQETGDLEDITGCDVFYQCGCGKREGNLFTPMFHYKQFPYRRIYNVTVCNEVGILPKENQKYTIQFEYELDRLLHIACINPEYAKYRIKELSKMKKLFLRQRDIGQVFVDYFVTANIILIKAAIVGKYLEKRKCQFPELKKALDDIGEGVLDENAIKVLATAIVRQKDILLQKYVAGLYRKKPRKPPTVDRLITSPIELYLEKAFSTYIYVYLLMYLGKKINSEKNIVQEDLGSSMEKILETVGILKSKSKTKMVVKAGDELYRFYSEDAEILMRDCCKQAGMMFAHLDKHGYYPDKYFSVFSSEEICYSAVKRLSNTEGYIPAGNVEESKQKLDAYTDLYYVKKLLEMD